ncbi:MAG: gamma-glutamyltransferase [Bacteriovoracaceae bacterium]|jgi:gamma-glutamyltranspeptidase / glutathione hydrolase|nr:gamma-glutamyltransferase [Bacteriovoracaceae bacterium]
MHKLKIMIFSFIFFSNCSGIKQATILAPLAPTEIKSEHESFGEKFMIASQGRNSTTAGKKMFKLGGNAVDAAAAISFSISVERPQSTGIGGGGFMLIKTPAMDEPLALDFREKAPLKAHAKMYLDKNENIIKNKSLNGIFSVGTPGLVAGVLQAHKKFGKLPLHIVMEPAITLASKGFKIYPELDRALKAKQKVLELFPSTKKIFFRNNKVMKLGDLLIQKDLAKTLETIAKKGLDGFYKGWVAKKIVKTSKKYGGLIRKNDLLKYNVVNRKPIKGEYKGKVIYSMAPPSSGGVHVVQILNTIENDGLGKYGPHHPKTVHLVSSAMQQAFADRARYLGDSDFVRVPIGNLISKKYAKKIRESINDKSKKIKSVKAGVFKEHDETTHFSVADSVGNVVVSTQTINGWFGSGLVADGTGIVLNNEMDDFATKVGASNLFGAIGGSNNLVAPMKRPLSSMSPTIVLKDNQPLLALGTPSGTRILTCVTSVILNYLEHELPLYDAVAAVRYHHQWSPDEIRVDKPGFPISVKKELENKGYKINVKNLGCSIQAIVYENGFLHGVSDPRGQGMSYGE